MGQFPLLTFQDILYSKTFIDKKVEIYIKECQKHNIVWIEGIVAEFHRMFASHKIDIRAKVHAIFLLKEIVQTCEYSVLMLVETYLLGFLTEIAEYLAKNPQLQKNSKYFESIGYSSSYPNIENLSHNFVVIGFEILYMCGMIRLKQNFQGDQLRKDSSFWIVLQKIKDKNHKIFNESQLRKKLKISELRQMYKQELKQFQSHSCFYIDHYMKKLEDFIFASNSAQNLETLDFRMLLKKGDTYLTSEAVARLTEMIDFVDDFKVKTRALGLLNEMILWGDVQAVITVNYTEYFEKIFRQLFKIDGSKGLKKGQEIFREIKGQFQDKRRFYCYFLRCLQVWAETFPHQHIIFYDPQESELASPIYKNYRFLKEVRKFVFPENPFLDKMKADARRNFKQGEERNKKIIMDLNKEINQICDQESVSFSQLHKKMQTAQRYLKKLKENAVEGTIQSMMQDLVNFSNHFELELQRLTEKVDNNVLDKTIERGLICIEIINNIQPEYERYKRGNITLQDFISSCNKRIDFSKRNTKEISLSSSKSINDRKSELRSSITNKTSKSTSSIKGMTEETRMKIIKRKYLQRLQKMANRSSSEKNDSVIINTAPFFNKRASQQLIKPPLESTKKIHENIREVKSMEKSLTTIPKSPRQSGKKIFLVSKYVQNKPIEDLQKIKNQVQQENWNSNKKIPVQLFKPNGPSSIFQNHAQFSFVDKTHPFQEQNNQDSKYLNLQSTQKKALNFIKIFDELELKSPPSSGFCHSPQFGNTQIKNVIKDGAFSQSRKQSKKGVGLAKQLVSLTDKLIGPKQEIVKFGDFREFLAYNKKTVSKKQILSKQMAILQNEMIKVDRITISNSQKLTITFYLFPKQKCTRIRLKVTETPSIYLNISEDKDIKVQKNYYELNSPKYGEQYDFQVTGTFLKAPIVMPEIQIRVNEGQVQTFVIPFPLMYMMKFKRPESRWLGKDFDLADKIASEAFERNKQMLSSISDLDDYMSELVEVKDGKNTKKYRTQCQIEKTCFILEVKQAQNLITLQACPLGENPNKDIIKFYIAQCMSLFS